MCIHVHNASVGNTSGSTVRLFNSCKPLHNVLCNVKFSCKRYITLTGLI